MSIVNTARSAADRFETVSELFSFLLHNKRWWIVPMLVSLLLLGVLIILAQTSAVAPFVYTLF
jgi:hypothetical protein